MKALEASSAVFLSETADLYIYEYHCVQFYCGLGYLPPQVFGNFLPQRFHPTVIALAVVLSCLQCTFENRH